jgi:hypothetical protein
MSLLDGLKRLRPGSATVGAISNTDIEGTDRQRSNAPVIPLSPEDVVGLERNWTVAITNQDPLQDIDETVDLVNGEGKLNPFEPHASDDPAVLNRLFRLNS